MEKRNFYIQFSILTALSFVGIATSLNFPALAEHYALAWAYFLFFSIFVWLTYVLAIKASKSENKNDYIRLTIALIFFKILFCIAISVVYDKSVTPTNNFHIIYFLVLYIIYSIFEFRVLFKMSYNK